MEHRSPTSSGWIRRQPAWLRGSRFVNSTLSKGDQNWGRKSWRLFVAESHRPVPPCLSIARMPSTFLNLSTKAFFRARRHLKGLRRSRQSLRAKIALLVDVEDWAYANIARQVRAALSDKFEFEILTSGLSPISAMPSCYAKVPI